MDFERIFDVAFFFSFNLTPARCEVQPICKVLFDDIVVMSENNEHQPSEIVDICEDHNVVNAKCSIDTKKEKTVLNTRAQVHHRESQAIDSTLPRVDCS